MESKENTVIVAHRLRPRQPLAVVAWSPNSLICPLASQHQGYDSCLESSWRWSIHHPILSSTKIMNDRKQILFHSISSSSTQVILADRTLPNSGGRFYWEIYVPAVYGTSLMFGIASWLFIQLIKKTFNFILASQQTLNSSSMINLLGIDQHGWGLSHHGILFHDGRSSENYLSQPLATLKPALIGLEFDADRRTLSYTINNQPMGIAFDSIPNHQPLYPAVSSTSSHSTMILQHTCQLCSSLRNLCIKKVKKSNFVPTELPSHLIKSFFWTVHLYLFVFLMAYVENVQCFDSLLVQNIYSLVYFVFLFFKRVPSSQTRWSLFHSLCV